MQNENLDKALFEEMSFYKIKNRERILTRGICKQRFTYYFDILQ